MKKEFVNVCVPVYENVNSWGTAGCMVERSPPSCRLPLQMSISGAGANVCVRVCVCARVHGFDQLELVCSVMVAQQQSLLHMDEKWKLGERKCELGTEEAKMIPDVESRS